METEYVINTDILKAAGKVYRAITHPLRQQIFQMIHKHGPISVTDLYIKMRMEQSYVSQHLAILREAGLVIANRSGKNIFYTINYSKMEFLNNISKNIAAKSSQHDL